MNKILDKLGITALNDMQVQVGNTIKNTDKDVIVLSPTGTGKTLAYLLPLQGRLDRDDIRPQMLVIVPGRELALQSFEVFERMKCGLKAMACYGGRAAMDEHRRMREVNPQVIFATPGRLLDHLEKGNIIADNVSTLVIDEFDKCLEMGFAREMQNIVGFLGDECRRILLSATDIDEIPDYVNMRRATKMNFIPEDEVINDRVQSYVVHSAEKDKLPVLARLLTECGAKSSIVFLNYRDAVERTSDYLRGLGFTLASFHGGLDQREREQQLYLFSNGSANIMVCTDLAARGLDVPSIENIIHFHLPLAEEEYVHRVGRTARWDAKGNTFFILGPEEHVPEYVDSEPVDYEIHAEEVFPSHPLMATIYIGRGKKDKVSKGDIVGFLCKIGGLKGDEIGRIDVKERYTYVAVSRLRVKQLLKLTANAKIKNMKTVVEESL